MGSILDRLNRGADDLKKKKSEDLDQKINDGSDAGNYAYRKAMMGADAGAQTQDTVNTAPAPGTVTPHSYVGSQFAPQAATQQTAPAEQAMAEQKATPAEQATAGQKAVTTEQGTEQVTQSTTETPASGLVDANGGKDSKQSDLDYLESFMPINKEEEEKRVRSANAMNGLGALSQAAAAFANYAYSGAPAITLKEYKGPDVQQWKDKLNDQRMQYLKMKMAINQNEINKNKTLQDMEIQRNQEARNQESHQVNIEGTKDKNRITKAQADNMPTQIDLENEARRNQNTITGAQAGNAEKAVQLENQAKEASIRATKVNTAIAQAKQKNEQQKETYYIAAGPELIGIDKNKINMQTVSTIHSMLRDANGNPIPTTNVVKEGLFGGPVSKQKTAEEMLQDIGQYLNNEGSKSALDYVVKNIGGKGKAKIDY